MICDYDIAGSVLRIAGRGAGLERLGGFAPFRMAGDPDREPLATVYTEADTDSLTGDTDAAVLDTFPLEDITCKFCRRADGYVFRMEHPDGRIDLLRHTTGDGNMRSDIGRAGEPDPTAMRFMLWMAYGLALLPLRAVAVHSSVIVHEGRAVMFLGESGTGKSTHTRLWLRHVQGTRLLNDDSPILRIVDGRPVVFGSPWSGKTPAYHNESFPVAAIVRLSQAPRNAISRLGRLNAFGALLPSCPPSFAKDETLLDGLCGIISTVVERTPVFRLECLPDKGAARLVLDTVFGNGKNIAE